MRIDTLNKRLSQVKKRREELIQLLKMEVEYLDNEQIEHGIKLSENGDLNNYPVDYEAQKEKLADINFINTIKDKIQKIPESNGSQYFKKSSLKIGLLADEFLYNSFKNVANLIYINKNISREDLKQLDLVIIASAWKGIENDWRGMANPQSKVRQELIDIINYLKKQSVKVVFYSKEDPTNYDKFVGIADKCDYIFTTSLEKVQAYRQDCNTDKVDILEFGVNPIYNNPIGVNSTDKLNEAIFAGSWYEKYPHRIKDSKVLFDGLLASGKGLRIIDRNFHLNLPNHYFPRKYLPYISPSVDHNTLQKTFKLFDWVVNLNSVKDSETMFANRVYELQAMGNVILSNYSVGINNKFPNVFMVHDGEEVDPIVNSLSYMELYEQKMIGVRKALKDNTTFHRINYLLNKMGFGEELDNKNVAIIVTEKSATAQENFNRQTYPNKELLTIEELGAKYDSFDYVAFFSEEYIYEEYYLEDMINGFKYTSSSYITKDAYLDNGIMAKGIQHDYVNEIKDKNRTVFATEAVSLETIQNISGPIYIENGYSIDGLEIQRNELLRHNKLTQPLKVSVIIPIYNNGEHLYSKCFMSLRRSSIFEKMDIILVDDGSNDNITRKIINRLTRKYENIQSYFFNDTGSGSASRPRNKGIELAKTEYITYLDPDNEAINDGYAELLKELENDKSLDMVVGNIVKFDTVKKHLNYAYNLFSWDPTGVVDDTHKFLIESKMRAQSIQALIVKKEIIVDNNLEMVEKATGQDTLFFQQLLLKSNVVKGLNIPIHIYYAAVTNSVTNTISKNFFNKYLILERERIKFLKENNLLDVYMKERFNFYFTGWYLTRVPRIIQTEIKPALDLLYEIFALYKPYIKKESEEINKFSKLMKKKKYNDVINYFQNMHQK